MWHSYQISSKHALYADSNMRVMSENRRSFVFKGRMEARALLLFKSSSVLKIHTVKVLSCLNFPASFFVPRRNTYC